MEHVWKKSSPELVALFDEVVPDLPIIDRRKMFGYPCYFIKGNLAGGLHEDSFLVRLAEVDRKILLAEGGLVFQPMPTRTMKEYVVLPDAILKDRSQLVSWIAKSVEYGLTLPEKTKKK